MIEEVTDEEGGEMGVNEPNILMVSPGSMVRYRLNGEYEWSLTDANVGCCPVIS
jgi:hypothetical protein